MTALLKRARLDRNHIVILILTDDRGLVLDEWKHPGPWTAHDGQVRTWLEQHAERVVASTGDVAGRTVGSVTRAGPRTYLVGLGMGVRVQGVVEGDGADELQERIAFALRNLMTVELARVKTGRPLVGPIGKENLLRFLIEGDTALPAKLVGPQHFAAL